MRPQYAVFNLPLECAVREKEKHVAFRETIHSTLGARESTGETPFS
jgi:hypothetical protein